MGWEGVSTLLSETCLRYLPDTEVCNTCSRSELLILCIGCVIGISAWCDFSVLFIEHFPFCGKLLRDVKTESVIRFMESQFLTGSSEELRNSAVCFFYLEDWN